jgi:mRNA interferase HicA
MQSSNSGFRAHTEGFLEALPVVFKPRPEGWQGEDWVDVDSDEFFDQLDWYEPWDNLPRRRESEPSLNPRDDDPLDDISRIDFNIAEWIERNYLNDNRLTNRPLIAPPRGLRVRGGFPGGPVSTDGTWDMDRPPPPDAIAFYLPAHYFPSTAGIYFILENVMQFCVDLHRRTVLLGSPAPMSLCVTAAERYLYAHEYYHHKVEMMSFRWEAFRRQKVYITCIRKLYVAAETDSEHLEESLASAYGVQAVEASVRAGLIPRVLLEAVKQYVSRCPPHYAKGIDILDQASFIRAECNFLERAGKLLSPKLFSASQSSLWESVPYRMAGSIRPGSRFTLLIDRKNAILAFLRLRLGIRAMRPRELAKELTSHGFRFERHGGNHDIYVSPNGHSIPVPRHPKDIHPGLLKRLQKEMRVG